MRVITKTPKKVVLEIEKSTINKKGFDYVWDEIRDVFLEKDFIILCVNSDSNYVFFQLKNVSDVDKNKKICKDNIFKKKDVYLVERELKKN